MSAGCRQKGIAFFGSYGIIKKYIIEIRCVKVTDDLVVTISCGKELCMLNEVLTINQIKEIVKPIALKYHVEEIYLFGSYARGEAL